MSSNQRTHVDRRLLVDVVRRDAMVHMNDACGVVLAMDRDCSSTISTAMVVAEQNCEKDKFMRMKKNKRIPAGASHARHCRWHRGASWRRCTCVRSADGWYDQVQLVRGTVLRLERATSVQGR